MAGGADEKWRDLGGEGRRHFQVILGERVIDRIVRQLQDRGVRDIGIICPPIEGYDVPGTYRVTPKYDAWGHEALNGQHLWHESWRTVQIYGDTVFADRAMDLIVGDERRKFTMYGRWGNGPIKGGGGELFAFSMYPEHREDWHDALEAAFALKANGIIRRAGAWEGYRYLAGARGAMVGAHRLYPQVFTHIGPPTDDFDRPDQLAKLRHLFEQRARRAAA
jgi:hypothetical protein